MQVVVRRVNLTARMKRQKRTAKAVMLNLWQLEPVKVVDTAPVESDCTSERCSCDKPNHPNLLHKTAKRKQGKQSWSLCGTWFKNHSWLLFCETCEFLAIDYMYITVHALLLIIKLNNFITLNVQPTQSKTCSSALACTVDYCTLSAHFK